MPTLPAPLPPGPPSFRPAPAPPGRERWALGAILAFASCLGVLLVQYVGTYAAALFLAPLPVLALLRPGAFVTGLRQDAVLLLHPLLAVVSTLWSVTPDWTIWAATELVGTMIVGIAIAHCVPFRSLLSGLLAALILVALGSLAINADEGDGLSRGAGLFGSKNQLGTAVAFLAMLGYVVATNRRTCGPLLRFGALVSLPLAVAMVIRSQSLGAVLCLGIALAGLFALRWIGRRRPALRRALLTLTGLGLALLVLASAAGLLPIGELMTALGKDPTLTGRTVLWAKASGLIERNPLLGLGFQGFWRLDNPEALHLWTMFHQTPGAGFHFHNTYYSVGVDLGLIGIAVIAATMLAGLRRCLAGLFAGETPAVTLATGLMLFLLIRSFIEVDLTSQFTPSSLFLCLVWRFARPAATGRAAITTAAAAPRTGTGPG